MDYGVMTVLVVFAITLGWLIWIEARLKELDDYANSNQESHAVIIERINNKWNLSYSLYEDVKKDARAHNAEHIAIVSDITRNELNINTIIQGVERLQKDVEALKGEHKDVDGTDYICDSDSSSAD